uniref:Uncharacterized protein n=1 Tax=Saimiri boliviensis boliviensis TaxID=39432 RepID=A0A2K6S445_SAIBB
MGALIISGSSAEPVTKQRCGFLLYMEMTLCSHRTQSLSELYQSLMSTGFLQMHYVCCFPASKPFLLAFLEVFLLMSHLSLFSKLIRFLFLSFLFPPHICTHVP